MIFTIPIKNTEIFINNNIRIRISLLKTPASHLSCLGLCTHRTSFLSWFMYAQNIFLVLVYVRTEHLSCLGLCTHRTSFLSWFMYAQNIFLVLVYVRTEHLSCLGLCTHRTSFLSWFMYAQNIFLVLVYVRTEHLLQHLVVTHQFSCLLSSFLQVMFQLILDQKHFRTSVSPLLILDLSVINLLSFLI